MAKLEVGRNSVDFMQWDGMQRFIHLLKAPFTEATLLVNVNSDKRFAKMRRTGYSLFLDAIDANPILAIAPIAKADGTGFILRITTHGIRKYTLGSGATTWGAEIYTFPNVITQVDWEFHYGKVYFATDTNDLNYLNTVTNTFTTVTYTSSTLNSKPLYLAVYQERLIAANMTDLATSVKLGSYVAMSRIGNGTDWVNATNDQESAQSFEVDTDHNGHIQGVFTSNNRVVFPKGSVTGDMSMYRWDGNSLLQVPTDVSIRPGTFQTWQQIDGLGYFANNNGIQEYAGDRPYLKSLALGDVNSLAAPRAAGTIDKKYLVALSSSITVDGRALTNPILVYDRIAQEFFIYNTAHRMQTFATFALTSTEKPKMYSGDANGNVYVWDGSNTDAGTVIHFEMEFRPFFGTQYDNPMEFQRIYAFADPAGQMQVQLKNVGRTDWLRPVELTQFLTELYLPPEAANGQAVSFRITGDTPGQSPVFYGFSMAYIEEPLI